MNESQLAETVHALYMAGTYKLNKSEFPMAAYREITFNISPVGSQSNLFKMASKIFPEGPEALFAKTYSNNGDLILQRKFKTPFRFEFLYKDSEKGEYLTAVTKNELLSALSSYSSSVVVSDDPRHYVQKKIEYLINFASKVRQTILAKIKGKPTSGKYL